MLQWTPSPCTVPGPDVFTVASSLEHLRLREEIAGMDLLSHLQENQCLVSHTHHLMVNKRSAKSFRTLHV